MRYFAAIEIPENENEAFGAVVPDVSGCFSAGDTFEEAVDNIQEALVLQLEDILERGGELPEPRSPVDFMDEYPGWSLTSVAVDPQQLSNKAVRINITMPEGLLYAVDIAAKGQRMKRSAFLAQAAAEKLKTA